MFIVIVEFHDESDTPKAFGPFDSRDKAQTWLDAWKYPRTSKRYNIFVPYTKPEQFARVTITTLEGYLLEAEAN